MSLLAARETGKTASTKRINKPTVLLTKSLLIMDYSPTRNARIWHECEAWRAPGVGLTERAGKDLGVEA